MVELLLARGAAIDASNKAGWTALHRAVYSGRTAAVRLLVSRGASVLALTMDGCTPLHLAARSNMLAAAEELLGAGARIDMTNAGAHVCLGGAEAQGGGGGLVLRQHGRVRPSAQTSEPEPGPRGPPNTAAAPFVAPAPTNIHPRTHTLGGWGLQAARTPWRKR